MPQDIHNVHALSQELLLIAANFVVNLLVPFQELCSLIA